MHRRVSSPRMIGRAEELTRLRDVLARVESGGQTAVLVSGEAGIGKTRLVNEFLTGCDETVRVARGGCLPLADGLLPYGPIVEMLRDIDRDQLGDPALRGFRLDLAEVAGVPASQQTDGDRYRMFTAIRRVLEHLATQKPLVVVLEDLHWAGPSTRELVAHLGYGVRDSRVLLIGTYRSDEVPSRHPLRSLLTELDRAGAERLELNRLGPAEVADQVAGILNVSPDPALVQRLHSRCDGNPFLVEELLAAGPDAVSLPERTRDILLQRVRALSTMEQNLCLAVAIAGRQAEHELLAKVMDVPQDTLLGLLRSAVDEQILIGVGNAYAFRHVLVAEALLTEAVAGDRIRLHRAYAAALTAQPQQSATSAGAAAERAYHWCQAGDLDLGLLACIDAGLGAEQMFAQSEARQHFDRAIELWSKASQARTVAPFDLVELCRRGAEAAYLEGDTDHAIALVRRALIEADPARSGMLYERLGRYLWANGDAEEESVGAYQRAVELVPDVPTAERARVLTGLASALVYADRPDPSAWCEEALRVARLVGARDEEGRALQSLGYCRAMSGDVAEGLTLCRQALGIAAERGRSDDHCRAYVTIVGVLRMAGRTSEAVTTALEGVRVARQLGADRTYGNLLLGDAIEALILLGRWDEADALLPDSPDVSAHGTPVIATNLWLSAANLHTWRGRFDESQVFLNACVEAYASPHGHVRSMLHANFSEWCLWQGRYAEASEWIRKELDLLGTIEFTSLLSRLVLQGLRAEAGLSRPSDLGRLTSLLDEMSLRPNPPPDAAALLTLCWAELARIRGNPDPDRWAATADQWVKLDMPWPLAYSRFRQAEILLAGRPTASRRADGAAVLSDAYAIASRLGAEPLVRDIVSLARRARLMSVIAPFRASADGPRSALTTREQDVLELICAGATNRRIAGQLFISEKTVSIHVSRVLAKLNAANRAEAIAIAHRTGLVRPETPKPTVV